MAENQGVNQKIPKGKVGGWRPGSGRKPTYATQLKRLALDKAEGEAEKSLAKLVELRDGAKTEGIQFAAAQEIMNRVWGKPKTSMTLSGGDKPINITFEEAKRSDGIDAGQGH